MSNLASEAIAGLKATPILLGVLLLNLVLVGGSAFFLYKAGEANAARFSLILERCLPERSAR